MGKLILIAVGISQLSGRERVEMRNEGMKNFFFFFFQFNYSGNV